MLKIAYKKINDFEAAEEIIQDAFLAFYNSKDKIEDNPALYIKGILKHKIFDYIRKGKIKISSLDEYEQNEKNLSTHDIFDNIEVKELDEKIKVTISRLPLQCRTAFLLSRNENMTYSEIAEKLGISIKTVEAHISKALKYLRTHLDHQLFWFLILSYWMR